MTQTPFPHVDLRHFTTGSPVEVARFIGHFGRALERIGFVAIDNSGLDPLLLQEVYQTAQDFFALPHEVKQQYHRQDLQGQRGFTPLGKEHAKGKAVPDLKEFWHMGPEIQESEAHKYHPSSPALSYPANLWPQEVPQFQPLLTRLYQELSVCSRALLEACALYIGEPRHVLRNLVQDGNTILRVLHYPQMAEPLAPGAMRAAPHEDINLITLLCESSQPGLELQRRDGSWQAVHLEPGQILCNAGDMLQWLTNGLFRSTTHRVVNTDLEESSRFAMPYFVHPRPQVDLTPLASCVAKTGGQTKFPPITAQAYLKQRLTEIGL
ncbi:MAG: isopenicillin N synthase family dioxygenase [Prochlorothrix sp.]|nr:2-oxoglutarate and iron-dependent oxygenase domain-containing protein [Prochlorothrix sp.]